MPAHKQAQWWREIYIDKLEYPGTLLATTMQGATVPGKWNTISLPATVVNAEAKYWMAVLIPNSIGNPIVNLRSVNRDGCVETSAQTKLTYLPSRWVGVQHPMMVRC